jgi:hypothetical protein
VDAAVIQATVHPKKKRKKKTLVFLFFAFGIFKGASFIRCAHAKLSSQKVTTNHTHCSLGAATIASRYLRYQTSFFRHFFFAAAPTRPSL